MSIVLGVAGMFCVSLVFAYFMANMADKKSDESATKIIRRLSQMARQQEAVRLAQRRLHGYDRSSYE